MLTRLILVAATLLAAGNALAAEEGLLDFRPDYGNIASMQRGARDFMAYCSGCHSLKYLRYSRMAEDLQIPVDLLKKDLMFTGDKPGFPIVNAMPAEAAQKWFGQSPPDLSLEARFRGADWIYTYLQSFYVDPSRPLGVNNLVLPGASMPDVLWELQGWQAKKAEKTGEHAAAEEEGGLPVEALTKGKLSPEEYRAFVTDLTNFLAYAAEPIKRERIHLGFKVLLFLVLLLILAILLKKEFWRDVH